eukprot:m.232382 g.232382  ORF g.232382 m.232382 type:complete len:1204 (-) comp33621_c1_seq1:57-3668(-)
MTTEKISNNGVGTCPFKNLGRWIPKNLSNRTVTGLLQILHDCFEEDIGVSISEKIVDIHELIQKVADMCMFPKPQTSTKRKNSSTEDVDKMDLVEKSAIDQPSSIEMCAKLSIEARLASATTEALTVLNLDSLNLGDDVGGKLADFFATNKTVVTLKLRNNNLADESGVALAVMLKTNTTLRTLNLCTNKLGDPSGIAFAEALKTNTSLTQLIICNNKLGDASGGAFVVMLTTYNTTLKILNIDKNDLISAFTKFQLTNTLYYRDTSQSIICARTPVCLVGFNGVGKTQLLKTWQRTAAEEKPHLDLDLDANPAALPSFVKDHDNKNDNDNDINDHSSDISVTPMSLRHMHATEEMQTSIGGTKRRKVEVEEMMVDVNVWDFAGHPEYFLSDKLLNHTCRNAVFVLLFRMDCVTPRARKAESDRLHYWLRFVASTTRSSSKQPEPQQSLPTVLIAGTFRLVPDSDNTDNNICDGDVDVGISQWTDSVLKQAKATFMDTLHLPQRRIFHIDCQERNDNDVASLKNAVAVAAFNIQTQDHHKVPPVCKMLRDLVTERDVLINSNTHANSVNARNNSEGRELALYRATSKALVVPRDEYEAGLIRLWDSATAIHQMDSLEEECLYHSFQSPPPASSQPRTRLDVILTHLHNVGDILWLNVEGARDVVVVSPQLFFSRIMRTILHSVDVRGGLVPKWEVEAMFTRTLGVSEAHVDDVLSILCELGLGHRHRDMTNTDSFLFPSAIPSPGSRCPQWGRPLPPGQHFVVGRRFVLADPTAVFSHGTMPCLQRWALGFYPGSIMWRDGVCIPHSATETLAEAGIQLHRLHASSPSDAVAQQAHVSSIVLVLKGSSGSAMTDCARMLDEICQEIRSASGARLIEEALSPFEVAKTQGSLLDFNGRGITLSIKNRLLSDDKLVIGGRRCTNDDLYNGSSVVVPVSIQSIPTPTTWVGNDFEPVHTQTPAGGEHLLVEVPRNQHEFNLIEQKLRHTLPNAVVSKIERVQNRSLWNKYYIARSDVAKACENNPNEIDAWHSTGATDPKLICSDWKAGFDVNQSIMEIKELRDPSGKFIGRQLLKEQNKVYGTGVYLAKHAIYADTLFPHKHPSQSNTKQILLAKVTLGKMMDYMSRIPDLCAAVEPHGYHSVSGTEGDLKFLSRKQSLLQTHGNWTSQHEMLVRHGDELGRQYVVHRSNQVYPAYLVTYESHPV